VELSKRLIEILNATDAVELIGGHQSRVFKVTCNCEQPTIAKVLDANLFRQIDVEARLDVIVQLADLDPQVCRPLPIGGRLTTVIAIDDGRDGLLTRYEFAEGATLDPTNGDDAACMGRSLARLHRSMKRLPPNGLPLVTALGSQGRDGGEELQIVHGDFNSGNLRQCKGLTRIFDFDDCGYGPVAFDVANALYMVLFDSLTALLPENYEVFAEAFIRAYCGEAGTRLEHEILRHYVDRRVNTLETWLDNIEGAPIGIRNSSPEWRTVLRKFIQDYRRIRP
jgi:Ser/Thr protein kinase RdoA (MazF antagonist)